MTTEFEKTSQAYNILKNYQGSNPYIIDLKTDVYAYHNTTLKDFQIKYILENHDKEPRHYGKIIKISKWLAEKKKVEWGLDFLPEKLLVHYIFAESDTSYHVGVQYRQSQKKMELTFLPKSEILTDMNEIDFLSKQIDFSKYNSDTFKLQPHQERAIKFLTTRKKGILSLEMGLGKTVCAIVSALEMKFNKILIICPASLKTQWAKEISRFEDENNITIVEGSNWDEKKFTIINYDILKKFHTVAKDTWKVKQKEYNDDGTISVKIVDKIVKTNKKDIVSKCLADSQLFNANFDLIIIDEAHRLSNKTSGIYEIVDDLIKRTNIEYVYALTGTMVKNDPMNLFNVLKIVGFPMCQTYEGYRKYSINYGGAKEIFSNKKERDYFTNIFLKQHNKNSWFELTVKEKQDLDEYLSKHCKKILIYSEATNLDELAERIKSYYYCETNEVLRSQVRIDKYLLEYDLTYDERKSYDNAWDEYLSNSVEKDVDKLISNHKLIEGSVFRQFLADAMVQHTIDLAEKEIAEGRKIIIFCCFDKELYSIQEHFGDKCVVYNGKMTAKKKDNAVNTFKTNDEVKVFIGNLQSASVGLNLNEASTIIFNNVSFVPSDNEQAEFRCLRIGQDKDVRIYYQKFTNTYMDRLFEILNTKSQIIRQIIKEEKHK